MLVAKISKRDVYTVVLEEMRSNFKAFGEGLNGLRDEMRSGFKEVHQRLDRVETDIVVMKLDISDIKRTLHIYGGRFQDHEDRISALENS